MSCARQLTRQSLLTKLLKPLTLAQVTLAAVQAWKKLDGDTKASFEATAEGAL